MTTYGTIPTSTGGKTNLEYLSRAKARIKSGLGTRRSWKEMFNLRSVDFPHGFHDAFSRIRTNIGYFRMNYAIIVLLILFFSLLWHPVSLIVFVVMMAVWLFLYFLRDEPLVIFHRVIDDSVVLVVLSIATIVFLLLTGATWNILLSVLIGLAVVVVHAAFRNTADLSLDEDPVDAAFWHLLLLRSLCVTNEIQFCIFTEVTKARTPWILLGLLLLVVVNCVKSMYSHLYGVFVSWFYQ